MVTMDGSILRFNPSGELTIYQVEEAVKALRGSLPDAKSVFVDLSITDKIDTAGVQLLVSLEKKCKHSDKEYVVEGIGGSVENFTTLFGYDLDGLTKGAQ